MPLALWRRREVSVTPARPAGRRGTTVQLRTLALAHRADAPASPIAADAVPLPLPGRERVAWRLGLLCLCLSKCRGRAASIPQLHILTWALSDEEHYTIFSRKWFGEPGQPSLRVTNPALPDLLRISRAAGFVLQKPNGRQELTEDGKRLVAEMLGADQPILAKEAEMLAALGLITESDMWRRLSIPQPPGSRSDED